MKEVFLGGTCSGSEWRDDLIQLLTIDYFNPVVSDWNEEAQRREVEKRQTCDFVLYVITPKMTGTYSIAEVVDDSNKRPQKTVFCCLSLDGKSLFTHEQEKSLNAVAKLVAANGANVFSSLNGVAEFLNAA